MLVKQGEQLDLFGGDFLGAIRRREAWAIALAEKAQRINRAAGYMCMSMPAGYEEVLAETLLAEVAVGH